MYITQLPSRAVRQLPQYGVGYAGWGCRGVAGRGEGDWEGMWERQSHDLPAEEGSGDQAGVSR